MNGFFKALQFLTILRCQKDTTGRGLDYSTIYFPLIGAFLGIILIGLNNLLFILFPEPLLSLILVTTLAILTGALHLDGLADTFDAALAGAKFKEERLAIMRDSHKGTFGVLILIVVILFKISLLSSVPLSFKDTGLFFMTFFSRYSIVLAISFFPYARQEGKAKIFFENRSYKNLFISTLIVLIILGLTFKWLNIVIYFLVIIFTLIMGEVTKRLFGGLTGDTLGAICELNEVVVLLSTFILAKVYL